MQAHDPYTIELQQQLSPIFLMPIMEESLGGGGGG
tara:strand:- start:792 stop:896 length:105 start_codon:yes stop_codon:yes gene_type:complete